MNKIVCSLLFISSIALAHGDDKPGPHGGKIDMPGAFHTEIVKKENGFLVYLLDMDFANPSVKDSQVQATLKSAGKTQTLVCKTEKDYFFCTARVPKSGELSVKATREKAAGNEVIFKF